LELTGEGRETEVESFGSDRERLGTGRESFRSEVKWFGSEREVREDRGWVVWELASPAWE
jgi:hypothetical protein